MSIAAPRLSTPSQNLLFNINSRNGEVVRLLEKKEISERSLLKHQHFLKIFKEDKLYLNQKKNKIKVAVNRYASNIQHLQEKYNNALEKTKKLRPCIYSHDTNTRKPINHDSSPKLLKHDAAFDYTHWPHYHSQDTLFSSPHLGLNTHMSNMHTLNISAGKEDKAKVVEKPNKKGWIVVDPNKNILSSSSDKKSSKIDENVEKGIQLTEGSGRNKPIENDAAAFGIPTPPNLALVLKACNVM